MSKLVTIKSITSKVGSGATPRGGSNVYEDDGISFIRSQNVQDMYFSNSGLVYLNDVQADKLKGVTVEASDVLLNITGDSIARSCLVPDEVLPARVNQHVAIIRCKNSNDARYLAYYLQFLKKHLLQICKVGGTRNALTKDVIVNLKINFPEDRHARGNLLALIDKKLDINYRIFADLEGMAKALYDYWFVQFDFPNAEGKPYKEYGGKMVYNEVLKREIPAGWELVPIEYFADVIDPHPSHRAPKEVDSGFPFAGIGDIDEAGNISLSKARKIDEEFVLKQEKDYHIGDYSLGYGRVGTVGKVVRLKKQKFRYALSPTLSVINAKKPEFAGYVYNVMKSEEFYKHVLKNSSGTTRPAIGIQLLRKIPVLKPGLEHSGMFEHYEQVTKELFEKTNIVNKESQLLMELRDWLLPMLMNGQVTVK
ncbi:restriction endonuclease subunit S [Vibrio splendidus]|uniref:restriction endonuclease subunit S n=1 Tax=Vibrio splendidus TaxID=29497 RepID=UPI002468EBD6|nr:restriction endonuclease subunit S [Vibrio splendidus]MDH5917741.1 restriction endonuclease subunit S [Vibrio splendidus]